MAGVAAACSCVILGVTPSIAAPTRLVEQSPVAVTNLGAGIVLVDFGRVAFGNIELKAPPGATNSVTVAFGEALTQGRVNRKPPGTVRFATAKAQLGGSERLIFAPAADKRNIEQGGGHPPAILTPRDFGVVLPFRWVEIEGWPGQLEPRQIVRRAAFASTWDDHAAAFESSEPMLNKIWELCRYSIKATTFAGLYVDGDRERIPYEADAYLNQISQYYTDSDPQMARDTFDHLMKHGTWPTEWAPHMVFMAHADWMQTGDTNWLAIRFDGLKSKLLMDRVDANGLVRSDEKHIKHEDIVDWPVGERDGFVFTKYNTVVNAFHLHALRLMSHMAFALGREAEAKDLAERESKGREAFQSALFDPQQGLFRDGEGTDHASLHANLFPLAFDLVPNARRAHIADWLARRGMRCSVYAAQYLLEGLFENGKADQALGLILANNDRSWRHMIESGTTITWEAWDMKYKPNQDWNHAWGAAPANLLPHYILGVSALEPGWSRAVIRPYPGPLTFAQGKVPTPRGPVAVSWKKGTSFSLTIDLPETMIARVELPGAKPGSQVLVNGQRGQWTQQGDRTIVENLSGKATFELR